MADVSERGCKAMGAPGESYMFDNSGNDGVNKLADAGVNISGWGFSSSE